MKLYYDCRPLVPAEERLTNYGNLYLTSLKSTLILVLSLAIRFIWPFCRCCWPNLQNYAKLPENSNL